jgi:hypothetical protein
VIKLITLASFHDDSWLVFSSAATKKIMGAKVAERETWLGIQIVVVQIRGILEDLINPYCYLGPFRLRIVNNVSLSLNAGEEYLILWETAIIIFHRPKYSSLVVVSKTSRVRQSSLWWHKTFAFLYWLTRRDAVAIVLLPILCCLLKTKESFLCLIGKIPTCSLVYDGKLLKYPIFGMVLSQLNWRITRNSFFKAESLFKLSKSTSTNQFVSSWTGF